MANFPGASNAIPGSRLDELYGPTYKDYWFYNLNLEKVYSTTEGYSVLFSHSGEILFSHFEMDRKPFCWNTNNKNIWSTSAKDLINVNNKFAEAILYIIKEIKADQIVSK